MADIKWIKLSTGIFDNRKIKQIESMPDGDTLLVIWLKLLILAGTVNDGGMIYFTPEIPYTDQLLATQFGRPLPTVQLALRTFEAFGMIETINDVLCVSNWERYQNIEGMEKVRAQTRKRVQDFRAKQKALTDCSVTSSVTVTPGNGTDKDIDIEKEKDISPNGDISKKKNERFVPPTVAEVRQYIDEMGYSIDPFDFCDYYRSQKWRKANGQPVADWKACVRTWERNRKNREEPQKTKLEALWGEDK